MAARIVVGVDGSTAARKALEWALDEARLREAELDVVYAWHYPYFAAMPTGVPIIESELLEEGAEKTLAAALEDVDTSGVTIHRRTVSGPAAMALIEMSEDADLIVLGSRGHGGFAGLVLGSVSQQVVSHAHCPVVVVREGPD